MNDVAVLTRPEGRDHCRGCLMQRRITTAVCVFTCIFAFSCCVYCTWIIQTSCCDKKKTSASDGHKNEQNITPSRRVPQSFEEISQEEKLLVYERIKRSNAKKKEKKNPRRHSDKKERKGKTRTRAAHYKAEVSAHYINKRVPGYVDSKIIDPCADVEKLDGKLCRNGRFTPNSDELKIFTEASWVNGKKSPFKQLENGVFEAVHKGIYLVYGQLLTLDNGDGRSVTVNQTRNSKEVQSIMCYEGYQDGNKSSRFKTCGIMALFSVEKKDQFIIKDFSNESKLDLRKGSNYFGAVVLK